MIVCESMFPHACMLFAPSASSSFDVAIHVVAAGTEQAKVVCAKFKAPGFPPTSGEITFQCAIPPTPPTAGSHPMKLTVGTDQNTPFMVNSPFAPPPNTFQYCTVTDPSGATNAVLLNVNPSLLV